MKDNRKQKTHAGWKIATVLLASTTLLSFVGCYQLYNSMHVVKEQAQTNQEIVTASLPKIQNELKAIKSDTDSVNSRKPYKGTDTSYGEKQDANKLDTIEYALNKAVLRSQLGKARDTIGILRSMIKMAVNERDEAREARRNISISRVEPGKQKVQENASIGLYEFSKKRVKNSLFSPERNYLRITNNIQEGVVNGLPYLDYELNNEQTYMFMVQARASYNPVTGKKLIGLGGELKVDRVSINVVNNFDSQAKHKFFNPSFGLRYDIKQFPLK